jgi:hypothetical protein
MYLILKLFWSMSLLVNIILLPHHDEYKLLSSAKLNVRMPEWSKPFCYYDVQGVKYKIIMVF